MKAKNILKTCLPIIGSIYLFGCATSPQPISIPQVDQYLEAAENTSGEARYQFQMQAVRALFEEHQSQRAADILKQLKINDTNPADAATLQLLQAELLIETHRADQALKMLNAMDAGTLSPDDANNRLTLLIEANAAQGNILDALNASEQQFQNNAGNSNAQNAGLEKTWEILNHSSQATLQAANTNATSPYQKGWLALVLAAYPGALPSPTSSNLADTIQTWEQQFPAHPAVALVQNFNHASVPITHVPQNIALLLPLTGTYGNSGNAVKNGFFAAYYYNKAQTGYAPTITVYDTNAQNITTLYQQAVNAGADFVVGPLLKEDVATLASSGVNVPTLTLNMPTDPNTPTPNGLYEFGLSPLTEIATVVHNARVEGHIQTGIIATNDQLAQNIAQTFKKDWLQSGGTVVATLTVTDLPSLATDIQSFLNLDASAERATQLDAVLGEKTRNLPHRREDMDMIFLVATPDAARQITPFLNFYYANNIPLYSTSLVESGGLNPTLSHDLDRIQFPQTPWLLNPKNTLPASLWTVRQQITQLWPQDFARQPTLYGFGVDAFNLINQLDYLALFPQFPVSNASGKLSLDGKTITRKLLWAQIHGGKIIVAS